MRPMVALNSSGATRESKPQGNSTLKRLLRPKLQNKRRIIYYACQIKNNIIKYSKFHTSHPIKIAHTLHSVTAAEFIVIFIPTTFKREGYYNFVCEMTTKAKSSRYCLAYLYVETRRARATKFRHNGYFLNCRSNFDSMTLMFGMYIMYHYPNEFGKFGRTQIMHR